MGANESPHPHTSPVHLPPAPPSPHPHPTPQETHRAYTPVSSLKCEGYFELLVRRVQHGAFSNWLCDLSVGDVVFARGGRGPAVYGGYGAAHLRLPARAKARGGSGLIKPSSLLLLSAGSGIAPMLALLRSLDTSATSTSLLPPITLVHASGSASEVGALAELLRLAASLSTLTLHLVLSSREALAAVTPTDASADGRSSQGTSVATAVAELADESKSRGNVRLSVGERLDASMLTRVTLGAPLDGACLCCCGPPNFDQDVMAWAKSAGYDTTCCHVF